MPAAAERGIVNAAAPGDLAPALRARVADCWMEVANAGGAVGFPFPPVGPAEAGRALDRLVHDLEHGRTRLLVATDGGEVAGWVAVVGERSPLVAHWATVRHLQTRPAHRGCGIGSALMREARRVARDELRLAQLHLAVRGGMGLEAFYARLGWREVGRWPGALRLAPGDDRDEVLMLLAPL
jgi:GNAT superfamily N-acetyltransferase